MRTLLQTLQCSLLSSDILSWHWTEWVSLTGSGHMVRTGQTGGEKELEPPHMNAGTVEWEKQAEPRVAARVAPALLPGGRAQYGPPQVQVVGGV